MSGMGTVPVIRQGRTYNIPAAQKEDEKKIGACIGITAVLIAAPIFLAFSEVKYHGDMEAFHEVEDDVVELADAKKTGGNKQVVHFQSSNVSVYSQDNAFGIWVEGALSLERVTEYCQWREDQHDSCEKCKDETGDGTHDCNCKRTFTYIKDWYTRLYSSAGYDQPAKHWNPQRDPYPSTKMFANSFRATDGGGSGDVVVGQGLLDGNSIRARSRNVDWTLGALPTPNFFKSLLGFQDHTRYEEIRWLKHMPKSKAYSTDKFVYVGQGGYFFSHYEGKNMDQLFNYFGQYLEGSLLDFQAGDIIDWLGLGCQAGDIRVRYRVQDPLSISVVGGLGKRDAERRVDRDGKAYTLQEVKDWYTTYGSTDIQAYWDTMKPIDVPELAPYRTPKGHNIAMVHEGRRSYHQMFEAVLSSDFWTCTIARLALLPWAWIAGAYLMLPPWVGGMTAPLSQGDWQAAAGVYALALGGCWAVIWGLEFDLDWHDFVTPLCLLVGTLLVVLSFGGSAETKAKKM